MINGNIIIAFFVTQYALFFIGMLDKSNKEKMQNTNERIEFLRNKNYKTLEEQNEFVKLKYNHRPPQKFNLIEFLKGTFLSMLFFFGSYLPLQYIGLRPNFFITLIISIIIVSIINKILRRYNLQRQDGIDTLFRKG